MKPFYVILVTLTIFETQSTKINPSAHKNTNLYLKTNQLIRKFGYPSESHTIQTADGYLLEMHRIPHGKSSDMSAKSDKPPVLLIHGLLGSSEEFFSRELPDELPFLLADSGFDVWLGNVRANMYSKAHVSLHPDDYKFWNFSWHESGIYDTPAQIDFICSHTGKEKIIYIGYSMGTTIFFVMTTTLPEYNKKIELSLLMGSIAYMGNLKSPLYRFLLAFATPIKKLVDVLGHGAVFPDTEALRAAGKTVCTKSNIEKKFCWLIFSLISGFDPKEFDPNLVPGIINHAPSSYSAKAIDHYVQLIKSGKFRQYDYGIKGNLIQYGSTTPPDYNLSLITTPIYMYEGKNDYLSVLKDSKRLAKELKSLKNMRIIDYPKFAHLDYIMALNAKKLVYDIMINDLMSHLNETNKIY